MADTLIHVTLLWASTTLTLTLTTHQVVYRSIPSVRCNCVPMVYHFHIIMIRVASHSDDYYSEPGKRNTEKVVGYTVIDALHQFYIARRFVCCQFWLVH